MRAACLPLLFCAACDIHWAGDVPDGGRYDTGWWGDTGWTPTDVDEGAIYLTKSTVGGSVDEAFVIDSGSGAFGIGSMYCEFDNDDGYIGTDTTASEGDHLFDTDGDDVLLRARGALRAWDTVSGYDTVRLGIANPSDARLYHGEAVALGGETCALSWVSLDGERISMAALDASACDAGARIALDPDTGDAWVAAPGDAVYHVPFHGNEAETVPAPGDVNLLAYDPASGRLFAAEAGSDTAWGLDPATGDVEVELDAPAGITDFDLGGSPAWVHAATWMSGGASIVAWDTDGARQDAFDVGADPVSLRVRPDVNILVVRRAYDLVVYGR